MAASAAYDAVPEPLPVCQQIASGFMICLKPQPFMHIFYACTPALGTAIPSLKMTALHNLHNHKLKMTGSPLHQGSSALAALNRPS